MHCGQSARLVMGCHFTPAPWPMEPAKQVPNGRGTMPQQPARVGLLRLATLRLRWSPNNEACCEWVPVDLLRRWHLITTSSSGCSLQLAAETKLEIMKSKRQQQQHFQMSSVMCVIIYLKNSRGKHSTENKPPQTTVFREKPTSAAQKIKLTIVSSCFLVFCMAAFTHNLFFFFFSFKFITIQNTICTIKASASHKPTT